MSFFPYGSHQIYCESHGAGKPLILIAANPASDVETPYLKIRDLRELIQERI